MKEYRDNYKGFKIDMYDRFEKTLKFTDNTLIMIRDDVPRGSVGISIVFDGNKKCHATLDIKQHKELLIQIAEAIEQTEKQTGSEEE